MADADDTVRLVRGVAGRRFDNSVKIVFSSGPDTTIASARQGGADGVGSKAVVLFGFKNGGPGTHLLKFADGRVLHVKSRAAGTVDIVAPDGAPFGQIARHKDAASLATDTSGRTLLSLHADYPEIKTRGFHRLQIRDSSGATLGRFWVVRLGSAWETLAEPFGSQATWITRGGFAISVPHPGTLVSFDREPTQDEQTMMLAVCVDVALGRGSYLPEMG
jgi:hypothetical protein